MADSFSTRITKAWFEGAFWPRLLFPLSILFFLLVIFRRFLYRIGLKKSYQSQIPVVVVGNVTVGGAGKSPLVSYLVKAFQELGLKPGIVSRGYGAKQSSGRPKSVNKLSRPDEVGDEPLMLFQKTGVPVVVCPVRSKAVSELELQGCDIVIADDGLQHLAMRRDIEICVLDAQRLWGNGLMLPAGPLREPLSRLWKSDYLVLNGQSDEPARAKFFKKLEPVQRRKNNTFLYHMTLKPGTICSLDGKQTLDLNAIESKEFYACAGIGNPDRFFHTLIELGVMFQEKSFSDHHEYSFEDFVGALGRPILMTEKDAVKCKDLGLDNAWYLPVDAELDLPLVSDIVHQLAENGRIPMRNID